MNLRQMDYIVALAEEGSIIRAADRVNLSRPALNHYLLDLEQELGVDLFKRVNKRLIPTVAGNIYIQGARQLLSVRKQTYKALEELSDCNIGTLRLGLTRGIGIAMFKQVFPIFHERYPRFSVDLLEGNVRELEAAVLAGKIDFALVGRGSVRTELHHITFAPCEVVIVLPPNHRLSQKGSRKGEKHTSIDLRELKEDSFILMNTDTNIRMIADYHFAKAGFIPRIMMECSLSSLAYHMVECGIGPSILMESHIPKDSGVTCLSLNPVEYWNQSIAFREGTIFTAAETHFIELVKDYFSTSEPVCDR